jgi:hypothetical protein
VTRRELLSLLAALTTAACAKKPNDNRAPSSPNVPAPVVDSAGTCDAPDLIEWTLSGVSTHAAILVPKAQQATTRFPVLVALHGRGEALKGPQRGALGWPNDYALQHALGRLCAPPLTTDDFEALVTPDYLSNLNRELATNPWGGLIVVCPYLPDLDLHRDTEVLDYGRFLVNVLLPRVSRELPATTAVGIDGVSLGGIVALRVGLKNADVFGAVGALQPAINDANVGDLVDLARAARAQRPTLALRLTTSHDDVYRDVTNALSSGWHRAEVAHDFSELPGPHDYVFNRGPGAYEMVTWQRRVLVA